MRRLAFSLFEMTIVLLLVGVLAGAALTFKKPSDKTQNGQCYYSTKSQMAYIQAMMEKFARSKDRLPLPAPRNVGVDSPMYGREASGGNIDSVDGTSWGALPFQSLGLPTTYAGDCWGNKFTYVVTTALTTNAAVGGFRDSAVLGNITVKTTTSINATTTAAWAVISHGEDVLGSVKLNYSRANAGDGPPDTAHGWCTGAATLKTMNCLATGAAVADASYNNGKDAGANYFDDVVAYSGKPERIRNDRLFGWGDNKFSQLGNGYLASELTPAHVYLSQPGGFLFDSITVGSSYFASATQVPRNHVCGLDALGKAYCWGHNSEGQVGDNSYTHRASPRPVAGGHDFIQLSGGLFFTCGLKANGEVFCWGQGQNGRLGHGTTTGYLLPTIKVVGSGTTINFKKISAGSGQACGLDADGMAYCWGANEVGQLGSGSNPGDQLTPVPVDISAISSPKFAEISAGAASTCGIAMDGNTYCWGRFPLGNGDSYKNRPESKVITPGGVQFTSIAVGPAHLETGFTNHSCGLDASGNAYCWGSNEFGQLGVPTTTTSSNPAIAVNGGLTFSSISAGAGYTCAIAKDGLGVPPTDGTAYCWGKNNYGQLGDGSTTHRSAPAPVAGGLLFKDIKAGAHTTCALTSAGVTYCWGLNDFGQLGRNIGPVQPLPLSAGTVDYEMIAAGRHHACGLATNYSIYCWGRNDEGQAGKPITSSGRRAVAELIDLGAIPSGTKFRKVAAGGAHSCGLTLAGDIYCWGRNDEGQLGNNSTAQSTSPVLVQADGSKFTDLVAGQRHTCALATGGRPYCWGWNLYGQLGDNGVTTPQSNAPVAVVMPVGVTFSSITSSPGGNYTDTYPQANIGDPDDGGLHTCGLTAAGVAYCWGGNGYGQLGDNSQTQRNSATPVSGSHVFTSIVAGGGHTCALKADSTVYCWGRNGNSAFQLGLVGIFNMSIPNMVTDGVPQVAIRNFTQLALGAQHTCGLKTGGTVVCWGSNGKGSLGSGDIVGNGKYNVTGGLTFSSIYAGGESTFGLVSVTGSSCLLPWSGMIINSDFAESFQSSAPIGSCVPETRICNAGVLAGTGIVKACTPGCDRRTMTWTVGANTCTVTVEAMRGNTTVPAVDNPPGVSGNAMINCTASGVMEIASSPAPTCDP